MRSCANAAGAANTSAATIITNVVAGWLNAMRTMELPPWNRTTRWSEAPQVRDGDSRPGAAPESATGGTQQGGCLEGRGASRPALLIPIGSRALATAVGSSA